MEYYVDMSIQEIKEFISDKYPAEQVKQLRHNKLSVGGSFLALFIVYDYEKSRLVTTTGKGKDFVFGIIVGLLLGFLIIPMIFILIWYAINGNKIQEIVRAIKDEDIRRKYQKEPTENCTNDNESWKEKLERAKKLEKARRFDDSAKIYDELELYEDAGRVRKEKEDSVKSAPLKVDIGTIDQSTKISDSVVQRSTIGGSWQKRISICPYCAEKLNFPKPPKFCPYCKEKILMDD